MHTSHHEKWRYVDLYGIMSYMSDLSPVTMQLGAFYKEFLGFYSITINSNVLFSHAHAHIRTHTHTHSHTHNVMIIFVAILINNNWQQ